MNKAILVGRLTKDPELKYTPQGTAVASFVIAVNRRFKSKNGESEADFIPVVVWGNLGENTSKYTQKGNQIAVCGRIQVRNYQANDGSKRYVTEIIAEEVTFVGSSKKQQSKNSNSTNQLDKQNNENFGVPLDDFHPMEDDDNDDLPF